MVGETKAGHGKGAAREWEKCKRQDSREGKRWKVKERKGHAIKEKRRREMVCNTH